MDDTYISASAQSFGKIRLNNNQIWSSYPNMDSREFVQVTLTPYGKSVTAIALQGDVNWVMTFTLSTSEDGTEWHDYMVQGEVQVLNQRQQLANIHLLNGAQSWVGEETRV